jgi:hypothetical protein
MLRGMKSLVEELRVGSVFLDLEDTLKALGLLEARTGVAVSDRVNRRASP